MSRVRYVRWLAVLSVMLVLLVGASAVYGGLRWSGFDPTVTVDGVDYNAVIAAPPGQECRIEGVDVVFHVEGGVSTSGPEAEDEFCDGKSSTSTSFVADSDDGVYVSVLVSSKKRSFPVDVILSSSGSEESCSGQANQEITCGK